MSTLAKLSPMVSESSRPPYASLHAVDPAPAQASPSAPSTGLALVIEESHGPTSQGQESCSYRVYCDPAPDSDLRRLVLQSCAERHSVADEGFRIVWPDGSESRVPSGKLAWARVWCQRMELLLGEGYIVWIADLALLVWDDVAGEAARIDLLELETHAGSEREVVLEALLQAAKESRA